MRDRIGNYGSGIVMPSEFEGGKTKEEQFLNPMVKRNLNEPVVINKATPERVAELYNQGLKLYQIQHELGIPDYQKLKNLVAEATEKGLIILENTPVKGEHGAYVIDLEYLAKMYNRGDAVRSLKKTLNIGSDGTLYKYINQAVEKGFIKELRSKVVIDQTDKEQAVPLVEDKPEFKPAEENKVEQVLSEPEPKIDPEPTHETMAEIVKKTVDELNKVSVKTDELFGRKPADSEFAENEKACSHIFTPDDFVRLAERKKSEAVKANRQFEEVQKYQQLSVMASEIFGESGQDIVSYLWDRCQKGIA